jgi:predicted DsbA family dithiol-disulfide isomerase
MLVEIWSDVACPFCYVGKRRFAKALDAFPERDSVRVVWKSFQLNPALRTDPSVSITEYLVREKGIAPQQAAAMNERVGEMGAEDGITFAFDRTIPANTFDAHRLLQFAARQGASEAAAERLFRAYFSEGRNVDDRETLLELGGEIGLDRAELLAALADDELAYAVRSDIAEAQELGVSGVPFFVIDRKYGVSGAQPSEVMLEALGRAFRERGGE